jgi:hypothetical protein
MVSKRRLTAYFLLNSVTMMAAYSYTELYRLYKAFRYYYYYYYHYHHHHHVHEELGVFPVS